MRLGFIGLGHMGEPMAARLLDDRPELVVWNRSPDAAQRLHNRGALVAQTPGDVFGACDCVILMLADLSAIEDVLELRSTSGDPAVRGRIVVNMGTIAPTDSRNLARSLGARGAEYVEAPVSGSRVQAENGTLVAMLAGCPDLLDRVEPVLAPVCQSSFRCGKVPHALLTKLAVNTFLVTMVTGLAEAVLFAQACGVGQDAFREVLDSGPMSSEVSRIKIAKFLGDDYTAHATIRDVRYNTELILEQAAAAGITLPLLVECEKLLAIAGDRGDDALDMVAVLQALRGAVRGDVIEARPESP